VRLQYTDRVGYQWLPITLAQLHDIEPYEVLQALSAGRRYPVPGRSAQGVRILTIWARTRAGRPLIVALRKVQDSQRDWWIVGARDMNDSEHGLFEQWETKAGGNHD
jgi:hypothetical protein